MSLGKIVYTESPLRLQTAQCTHSPVTSTLYRYGLFRVSKQEHVIPVFCLQQPPDISFASCDDTREVVGGGRERGEEADSIHPSTCCVRREPPRVGNNTNSTTHDIWWPRCCRTLQRVRNVKKSTARKDFKARDTGTQRRRHRDVSISPSQVRPVIDVSTKQLTRQTIRGTSEIPAFIYISLPSPNPLVQITALCKTLTTRGAQCKFFPPAMIATLLKKKFKSKFKMR